MQPTRLVGDHFGELVQSYDGFQMYIPNTSSSLFRLSVGELVESCDGFADVHSESCSVGGSCFSRVRTAFATLSLSTNEKKTVVSELRLVASAV